MHDMVFRTEGKPSTSHLFNVRDAITGSGNPGSPHGQFLDHDRRWQVGNMLVNHQMDSKRSRGFDWIASSSKTFGKDSPLSSATAAGSSFGWQGRSNYNYSSKHLSSSTEPIVINDGIQPRDEMPFRLEVAYATLFRFTTCFRIIR